MTQHTFKQDSFGAYTHIEEGVILMTGLSLNQCLLIEDKLRSQGISCKWIRNGQREEIAA